LVFSGTFSRALIVILAPGVLWILVSLPASSFLKDGFLGPDLPAPLGILPSL